MVDPLAATRRWLPLWMESDRLGGTMLRADPVSTRKYLLELVSKTWRRDWFGDAAERLFTFDRFGSFPDLCWEGTCTEAYRRSPTHHIGNEVDIGLV